MKSTTAKYETGWTPPTEERNEMGDSMWMRCESCGGDARFAGTYDYATEHGAARDCFIAIYICTSCARVHESWLWADEGHDFFDPRALEELEIMLEENGWRRERDPGESGTLAPEREEYQRARAGLMAWHAYRRDREHGAIAEEDALERYRTAQRGRRGWDLLMARYVDEELARLDRAQKDGL